MRKKPVRNIALIRYAIVQAKSAAAEYRAYNPFQFAVMGLNNRQETLALKVYSRAYDKALDHKYGVTPTYKKI